MLTYSHRFSRNMRVSSILMLAIGVVALACLAQTVNAQGGFFNGYDVIKTTTSDTSLTNFTSDDDEGLSPSDRSETDDDHNWPFIDSINGASGPLQASTAALVAGAYLVAQYF